MSLEDIFPNEASLATAMAKCETQKRQKNGWAKKWVAEKWVAEKWVAEKWVAEKWVAEKWIGKKLNQKRVRNCFGDKL